jgi:filamentous hemagglutinin family protein
MQNKILLGCFKAVISLGPILGTAINPSIVNAQLRPDLSLGREKSIVRSNFQSQRGLTNLIDGGAIRGSNLFHSFAEFNVNRGEQVHFADPAGISNIITRVTGLSQSNIDGTLGVLGSSNLFLINPNGIVFGPRAKLDIKGSFVASTADRLEFKNGYIFNVTRPGEVPLLTIDAPLGLSHWLPESGTITNSANLSVGTDLSLVAKNLDLQGELKAGRNLNLVATEKLIAKDSSNQSFVASAGENLLLQGNRSLEISVLNHPDSKVESGKNLVLRSNQSVVGDARFTAGGNIQIEQLDGSLGDLHSIQDPVFEVAGNFSLNSYTGASLQILAGGSVSISGDIVIDAAGGPFNDSTVTLSDGSSIEVKGTTQPTLDVRAGTTGFFSNPTSGVEPSRADISIGSITNSGGLVFLTNQFQPNTALAGGDIQVGPINTTNEGGGGSVVIDARGALRVSSIDVSGSLGGVSGNGGNINLIAQNNLDIAASSTLYSYGFKGGNITLTSAKSIEQDSGSAIESSTWGPNQGGDVTLTAPSIALNGNVFNSVLYYDGSSGDIRIKAQSLDTNNAQIQTQAWLANANSGQILVEADSIALNATDLSSLLIATSGGKSGDIDVQSNSLSLTNGAQIGSRSLGFLYGPSSGDTGNIKVSAKTISLSGYAPLSSIGEDSPTAIWTVLRDGATGTAGNVDIQAESLVLMDGAQLGSIAYPGSTGNTGKISVQSNLIALSGYAPGDLTSGLFVPTAIRSTIQPGAKGNSGSLNVNTGTLSIQQGAAVGTSSFGIGDAGTVSVNASDSITIDGAVYTDFDNETHPSNLTSELGKGAVGNGGKVTLSTATLKVMNGGTIATATDGAGDAGDINITASELAAFDGVVSFANVGLKDRTSRAAVLAAENATGRAGNLTITTPTLSLTNGAQLNAETRSAGDAGTITLDVAKSVFLSGTNSGFIARTTPTSTGKGGDIIVKTPNSIQVRDGAKITAETQGTGKGGSIQLLADSLALGNGGQVTVETQGQGDAGQIDLQIVKSLVLDGPNSAVFARTASGSAGDSGSILINSSDSVQVLNGAQISAETQGSGKGGSIQLRGDSLRLDNAGQLSVATQGSGNSGTIDLQLGGSLILSGNNSGLLAQTAPNSTGSGGKITIQTPGGVRILNGAQIAANTEGSGAGGNVDINARSINLDANGQITAETKGQGTGGNISLNANRIEVGNGGQITGQTQGSGNAGSIKLTTNEALNLQGFGSGILANTGPNSTGNGGDISVFSLNALNIENGARLAVDSQGEGAGGDITVRTRSIDLNNAGVITAETASTKGGNVSIFSSDPLNMTNNSRISTTAGTAKAGGDGGNIVIKAPFLISGSNDNSDITANAYSGRGGRVEITTNGILGMTVRSRSDLESALGTSDPNRLDPALLPTSDITAISQTNPNLNGVVDIRSFDSDPFQNVYILPSTTVDASKLVARGCSTGSNLAKSKSLGTLVVTGRGGLPPSPTDQLDANGLLLGWESSRPESLQSVRPPQGAPEPLAQTTAQQIVEAQAFAIGPSGQVTLVARTNDAEPTALSEPPQLCSANE